MSSIDKNLCDFIYSLKSALISYFLPRLYRFLLCKIANNSVTVVFDALIRIIVPQTEKSDKFTGVNFKGWQQRVVFCLTTLRLHKFTSEETPLFAADMPDRKKFMIIEAWKHANFLCKGYILSALEDDLYNVYRAMSTYLSVMHMRRYISPKMHD